jgi:hypothetical protein
MKIISESDTKIVIKASASFFGAFVGFVFFLAGAAEFVSAFFLNSTSSTNASGSLWTNILWGNIVFGLIFIIIGGAVFVAFSKVATITLDKTLMKVSILRKSLFGNHIQEIPLNQISKIGFQEVVGGGGGGAVTTDFELFFMLSDGTKISFDNRLVRSKVFMNIGSKASGFLNVPFGRVDDPFNTFEKNLGIKD